MLIKTKQLFLIFISISLIGCASVSEDLGITQLEWSSYSADKQKKLLTNYGEIIKERNTIIEDQKNSLSDVFLAVKIHSGKVMFPPSFIDWQTYKPVSFKLFKGQCRNIEITSSLDENIKTTFGVCFKDNTLYLDPSRYDFKKKIGSVMIHSSPLWSSGFSYTGINSSGYLQLNDVTVEIKKEENSNPSSPHVSGGDPEK